MIKRNPKTLDTITQWRGPNTMLHSQYGYIDYKTWCEHEQKRIAIAKHGCETRIITAYDGEIALQEVGGA